MNIIEEKVKPISIDLLLQQDKLGYSIFIKIGLRYVNYCKDVTREELESLKLKKVQTVYLLQEEYGKFIADQVEIQDAEQNREHLVSKETIKAYINDHALLKDLFAEVGLQEKKLELINLVNKKSLEIIQNTDSLTQLFEHFKATHETSIIKKQMETYLVSEMLSFIFSKEEIKGVDQYISQMSRAILVCDLLLTEEEYWQSHNQSRNKLSAKILNHGEDILKHIPTTDFLSPPFLTLIKQHHEKPDGSGFPKGINYTQQNQFVCIYFVAEMFVTKFLAKKMKMNSIPLIIDEVNLYFKKFLTPNIEKSLLAFNHVMKNEKQYFAEDNNE